MSMETCRIVTCSSYFKTQTTDGVVLVFSYYLSNNQHYFEFTFSLYSKICHIKTFRFSHQKKCLQRNYKTIKAMCKKGPRHCQYSLLYNTVQFILLETSSLVTSHFTNLLNLSPASAEQRKYILRLMDLAQIWFIKTTFEN